jgi:hypothetical protein
LLLVNNTYKPLNYYVYGQTCDVFCTDPYVPLSETQLDFVGHALECARDACAPNPFLATLWTSGASGMSSNHGRLPTPIEERMMAFYAMSCGTKGLLYFDDTCQTKVTGPAGRSEDAPLWQELARINADVKALAPYLALSCPIGGPVETDKVWVRSLMCGPNVVMTVVVNKGHEIPYGTDAIPWRHRPAKRVSLVVPVPSHFKNVRVEEVRNGKLVAMESGRKVPTEFVAKGGEVRLNLDSVDTGRAFLITTGRGGRR